MEDQQAPRVEAKVVTLCGSTRFEAEFAEVNERLTLAGCVVLSPGMFSLPDLPDHPDGTTDGTDLRSRLGALHLQKIRMADEVYVVDPGGYVGESTRREIDYAESLGKPVRYLSRDDRRREPVTETDQVTDLLADFPVQVDIPVAWADMDAMGHVNNVVYFRYFETARIACFGELGLGPIGQSTDVGPILHSTSCRYRIPLTHPDTVTVGARIGDIGEDRFDMSYRVVSHRHGAIAAEGEALVVTFSYAASSKAPVPDALRARLLELRGDA